MDYILEFKFLKTVELDVNLIGYDDFARYEMVMFDNVEFKQIPLNISKEECIDLQNPENLLKLLYDCYRIVFMKLFNSYGSITISGKYYDWNNITVFMQKIVLEGI